MRKTSTMKHVMSYRPVCSVFKFSLFFADKRVLSLVKFIVWIECHGSSTFVINSQEVFIVALFATLFVINLQEVFIVAAGSFQCRYLACDESPGHFIVALFTSINIIMWFNIRLLFCDIFA